MATEAGKGMARQAVLGAMAANGWNPARLADEADIDYGTVGDFLNGKRWPKVATQGKIERALGWTPGTLAGIGEELQEAPTPGTVSPVSDDVGSSLLYRTPEGITEDQWEQIKASAEEWIEWQIDKASKER